MPSVRSSMKVSKSWRRKAKGRKRIRDAERRLRDAWDEISGENELEENRISINRRLMMVEGNRRGQGTARGRKTELSGIL